MDGSGSVGTAAGAGGAAPLFQVVLHEPEIPNNTGNIGRTCVATGCGLHLIRPLGFSTSEKACRRAGLDYWPRLAPREHESFGAYVEEQRPARLWLFTTKADVPVWEADLRPGDHLVFGKETRGLPDELLGRYADRLLVLPMRADERSLNLATAVCAVVYEGLRQCVSRGDLALSAKGRLG
jgi:tRNA (cytidine/uridine-2'-O-)-methyltransferase